MSLPCQPAALPEVPDKGSVLARIAYALYKGKFLNAVSVGWSFSFLKAFGDAGQGLRDVSSGMGAAVWLRINLLCVRVLQGTVTV
jgi:hypothetical protein